jgi:hypothetical protein
MRITVVEVKQFSVVSKVSKQNKVQRLSLKTTAAETLELLKGARGEECLRVSRTGASE